jgi:hypothetical protein
VVEAVFVIPLIMMVVTLIPLQVMAAQFAHQGAEAAARQGVETARRYGATNAQGAARARTYLDSAAGSLVRDTHISVERAPASVSVHVRARVVSIVPGFTSSIDVSSSGPIERFVPSAAAP